MDKFWRGLNLTNLGEIRQITLREEILANQPLRQFRCNLTELILANSEKIQIWRGLILANRKKKSKPAARINFGE